MIHEIVTPAFDRTEMVKSFSRLLAVSGHRKAAVETLSDELRILRSQARGVLFRGQGGAA